MSIHTAMIEENLDQREGQPEPNSAGRTGGGAVLGATPCSEIPPPWHSLTGYVFRCPLTGNMVIREGEKERMLVVSEATELMMPTKPCAQSAYDSLAKKIHFPNAGGMARELAAQDSESPTKQNG